jgi:arylsulfatase A-like enzyme
VTVIPCAEEKASCLDFKEYKHYSHEGGISSPLILHWPKGISGEGKSFRKTKEGPLYDSPAHLIDIMATAIDLAGTNYPDYTNGNPLIPLEGLSLRPSFTGIPLERGKPLFFEHEGNRAIRDGKWKLVSKGPTSAWELYDMEKDRTEMNDLSRKERNRAAYMMHQWEQWAHERGVVPFRSWFANPAVKKSK